MFSPTFEELVYANYLNRLINKFDNNMIISSITNTLGNIKMG